MNTVEAQVIKGVLKGKNIKVVLGPDASETQVFLNDKEISNSVTRVSVVVDSSFSVSKLFVELVDVMKKLEEDF